MIPFVNLNNPLPTTPGTGLTAGQEAQLATAARRQPVTTIAALKALTPSAGDAVQVLGYYAAGDGGGGTFYYDAGASTADNGGTIFAPTAGSGRWLRAYSGAVNVRWFGAKGDGVANDTTAFAAAIASAEDMLVPPGSYLIDYLDVNRNIRISGSGRKSTKLLVASYGTHASTPYGVLCRGATNLQGLVSLSDLEVEITSEQANQVGIMVTRKTHITDVHVHDAPGDGLLLRSVNASTEAPFFCRFENVQVKSNGRDGCRVTENCNANLFINCQFDTNGAHGWHQIVEGNGQPAALYSNLIFGGQASYNQNHGIYVEHGAHLEVYGTYAEFNSQADGGNPKTGAYNNLQLGANATRCNIVLGEQGTDTDLNLCVGLNTVAGNNVSVGGFYLTPLAGLALGYANVGAGRAITFEGALDCQHTLMFREVLTDRNRIRYDGTLNCLLFEGWSGSAWVEVQRVTTSGALGFFGSAGATKPTVTGSRGGNAALSSLITALASLGLVTDSSS